MKKNTHADQFDLFIWAESKPSNVIDARVRFENRTMAFVIGMINGHLPVRDGQVISGNFRRDINQGAA